MPQINTRYIRTAPNKDETIVNIKTEKELEHNLYLYEKGFKFKEVVPSVVPEGVCISCEG